MFKGFLTWFIFIVLAIAFLLYIYGEKMLSNMTSATTEAYVDDSIKSNPAFQNWVDYNPPSKKFTSKFPSSPQHATDKALDSKTKEHKQYEMYISESNGRVFMISVISFLSHDKSNDGENVLKSIVDSMVSSNPGNKLEKIQIGSYQGKKDMDFLITNPSYAISGRALFADNQVYVLSVLSKTVEESKSDFDYFTKSFKINSELPEALPKVNK